MRFRKIIFIGILLGGIYLQSCEKVQLEQPKIVGTMSFSKDIVPIFTDNCIICHGGSGTQKPDLTAAKAYTSLKIANLIDTISPETSGLYKQVSTKSSHVDKTSSSEKAKILLWLQQGAKNN